MKGRVEGRRKEVGGRVKRGKEKTERKEHSLTAG